MRATKTGSQKGERQHEPQPENQPCGPTGQRGIVRCKTVNLREKLLRRLLGDTRRVTIIVPGGSVKALSVQEVPEVGGHECA